MNTITPSTERQMNTLRDALERSARATSVAEARANRALSDLQVERGRLNGIERQMKETALRLEFAVEENRRLRNLIGNISSGRTDIRREVEELLNSMPERDQFSREVPEVPAPARQAGQRAAA